MTTKKLLIVVPLLFLAGCTNSTATTSPTPTPQTNTAASYSTTEVSTHSTRDSCWVIVNNNVYDVTQFGPKHPGGDKIYQGCGQNISEYIKTSHKPIDDKLPAFKIGSLKP